MEPKLPHALCGLCPLQDAKFTCVPGSGSMDSDALIVIGEAPGREERIQKKPFVGPSGRLLDHAVKEVGGDPAKLYKTNAIACWIDEEHTPDEMMIQCCNPRLKAELDAHPGKTILALGKTAQSALSQGFDIANRGLWFPFDGKAVMPTWHPAYVLRKPSEMPILLHDIRVSVGGYQPPKFVKPPETVVINSVDRLREVLSWCPENEWVGFDIETDQVNWYDKPGRKADAILCIMLAWCDKYGIVLDDAMLYDTPGTVPVLQEFANRRDLRFCAHNGQFDMVFLQSHFGLKMRCDFDTMIAHYCLDENSKHALKPGIIRDEFGLTDYEDDLIKKFLKNRNDSYSKIPFEFLSQYGVWDVVVTRALAQVYTDRLKSEGLYEWPYMNVLMPAHAQFVKAELRGLGVDVEYLKKAKRMMELEMERIVGEGREMVNVPALNFNAPAQLAEVIYNQLGLPRPKSNRIKPNSTAHDAIEPLKGKHPFIDLLMYHRRVAKIKSSYVDNMLEYADLQGRVHPQPIIIGTEIGRIAMRDPAAQTIPRPDDPTRHTYNPYEDGAIIRGAIVPDSGNDLVIADFSQAELRVAAVLSREPFLLEAYRSGEDLHTKVALAMYGPGFTKEQRVRCKMFNFSYLYGGSEYSFALDAGLPIDIARSFVRDYNKVMPLLAAYRKDQFNKLLADGYVSSVFGRRRRFPLITNDNRDDAAKAVVHMPIASTASDLTMISATRLLDEGLDVVLTVHDSIVAEAPKGQSEEVSHYIAQVMVETGSKYLGEVPWKVDSETQTRWATPPTLVLHGEKEPSV